MTKILPSQLTYEQLMSVLEDEDSAADNEILESYNDVVPFLTNYNITPGDTPVSKKLLYKLYKTYSTEPMTNIEFAIQVGEFVEAKNMFYYLNIDNFAVSKHIYMEQNKIDKTKSLTYQTHYNWFIKEINLQRGMKWIEGFVLFYIYKDFCKARRVNPKLGYNSFHRFLKLHFQFRRKNENRSLWFRVDDNIYNLLTETEKDVLRDARQKTGRSKKEVNRKETTPQ
jgi:hypothetical protein